MIQLINISKRFAEKVLYQNTSLTIKPSDRIGLVGSNGSGKTTLLNIIARCVSPDAGEIIISKGFRLGILEQEFKAKHKTVIEEVKSILFSGEKDIEDLNAAISREKDPQKLAHLMRLYTELEHNFETKGGYDLEVNCKKILGGLGFSEEMMQRECSQFSGGQIMRISLAKLLAAPVDGILLDEPTNHLDLPSLLWFEDYLKTYPGLIIMISHDRTLLNNVVRKIVEISNRKITVYDGNYDQYVENKAKIGENLENTQKRLQKEREKTERFIERFRYKNTRASMVQSRIKKLEKESLIEVPQEEKHIEFHFPQPERSGYEVITLKAISKRYGQNDVLKDVDFSIKREEKVFMTGKNGTGKSTLLKIMADEITADGGSKKLGVNVTVGYFSQIHVEQLDSTKTIMEEMEKVRGTRTPTEVRKLLGQFFFTNDDVFKQIGSLSGGEKSRVLLARLILSPANLLLLDEPTNHLDMPTQKVLLDALDEFSGTLCVISHDRHLINSIATRLLYFDDEGIAEYPGTLDEFIEWRSNNRQHTQGAKEKSVSEYKEQKRKEAEDRNYRYKIRKELDNKIDVIEKMLEKLMDEETELTNQLADTSNYKNQDKIKQITKRYQAVKDEISRATEQWETLSLERENWL